MISLTYPLFWFEKIKDSKITEFFGLLAMQNVINSLFALTNDPKFVILRDNRRTYIWNWCLEDSAQCACPSDQPDKIKNLTEMTKNKFFYHECIPSWIIVRSDLVGTLSQNPNETSGVLSSKKSQSHSFWCS